MPTRWLPPAITPCVLTRSVFDNVLPAIAVASVSDNQLSRRLRPGLFRIHDPCFQSPMHMQITDKLDNRVDVRLLIARGTRTNARGDENSDFMMSHEPANKAWIFAASPAGH